MNAEHRLTYAPGRAISADELDTFVRAWPDEARNSDHPLLLRSAEPEGIVVDAGEVTLVSITVTWTEDL